jgi:hypothetical protein
MHATNFANIMLKLLILSRHLILAQKIRMGAIQNFSLLKKENIMSKSERRITEIQESIRRHQEAVKSRNPAGHNVSDEDLTKVASFDIIGKTSQGEDLKK